MQIKTNSLLAYLFTQEINPFELCTICFALYLVGCFFYLNKNGQKPLWLHRGAQALEAGRLTHVREAQTQLGSNLLKVSPRRGAVLILAIAASPYQQILIFHRHVGSGSHRTEEEKEKEEEGGEKNSLGLEDDIVCMCTQAQGLWPAA